MITSLVAGIATISSPATWAQQDNAQPIQEVLVMGGDFDLGGNPQTAAEGRVFEQQLALRPISRTAELLEFVPGMIATQHSGEGKANQYFVRGFNLDHGTDFAMQVDGIPVNMPSHGHGQGYADLNFIIPELVESLSYRKGPYYADGGDFATAGSAEFSTVDRLEEGQLALTAGEYDYYRLFAGQSFELAGGALTAAGATSRYNGPWELDQDLDSRQAFLKYQQEHDTHAWSLTGMSYRNSWDATDQIPQRAVDQGLISRWSNIDPTDGGDSRRDSVALNWVETPANGSRWEFNGWAMDYALDLYSNFTYFDANPERGDQFQQSDSRRVVGFETEYRHPITVASIPTEAVVGFQHRYDDIHVGLHLSEARQRYDSVRDDQVEQSLSGLYGSLEQQWSDRLRSVISLRADHYRYQVNDLIGPNSGTGKDTLVSPRFSLIYTPVEGLETFASAGQGFHSNDARGATIKADPVTGEAVNRVDPLAKARSYEVGFRSALLPRMRLSVTAFSMRLSSELIYVGDEGVTEAVAPSRREGAEASLLYTPLSWLLIDAELTHTRAKLRGVGEDDRIPNSVSNVASLGIMVEDVNGWSGGIRWRYLGRAPLTEASAPKSDATLLSNAQLTYQFNPRLSATLELLNAFDSDDRDITYYYASRLPWEDAAVDDIHFHPAEPRALRFTVNAKF